MWKSISQWLLYKCMGWTADVTEVHPDKFIICLAPHTSNWDFLIGQLYSRSRGMKSNFLMKKEWFFWPLGPIFRSMGGIPVYRSKHTSMTDNLAETAKRLPVFQLCITPEGTRKRNPEWKRHPHPAVWCRLRAQAHPVHQDHRTQWRYRGADA